MGLDVYKLKIAGWDGLPLVYDEMYDHGVELIVKDVYEKEYLETKNNHRLINLFERFKDHVRQVAYTTIDYDHYTEKYGKIAVQCDSVLFDQLDSYFEDEELTRVSTHYKYLKCNELVHIFGDTDGNIIGHSDNVVMITHMADSLVFRSTDYQRSNDKTDLYDKFYGDCWYKKENTGLLPENKRWFVYKDELDELKSCFIDDSYIQTWKLADDEIIYLNP